MNFYLEYIKPKEIIKDINHFYSKLEHLICNDLFPKYVHSKRKSKVYNFDIKNFLSEINNTRLRFKNDILNIKFSTSATEPCDIKLSNLEYKNHYLTNTVININFVITPIEEINRIIFKENKSLMELRKNVNIINEFYVTNFRKSEERKFRNIYLKLNNLKKINHLEWNKLIDYIKCCVDPNFKSNINKILKISKGIDTDKMSLVYKLIQDTEFYKSYRSFKYDKFIRIIHKTCLDDEEIVSMSNQLANCFGHHIKNYNDSIIFIENLINHFNAISTYKRKIIDQTAFIGNKNRAKVSYKLRRNPS